MKILLGKNIIDKPVYWDISAEKNPHLIVLGTSGSGKTETLKAIISELNNNNIPSLIIDFHNEYEEVTDNILELRKKTINPLEFSKNEKAENVIYEVADIIKKVFKLGEIQESVLRQAIRQSYLAKGINLKKKDIYKDFPNFSDIEQNIYRQEDSSNRTVINSLVSRIEALFDIDIFSGGTNVEFNKLLRETTAVELKDFPTETVKSAIAEFFLNKLTYYIYSLKKTKKIRMYCIIDEAHRLMYENSPLDKLLRESRKYGVGVILASQRPSDFNETVLANAGGLLSFQCNLDKDAKFVAKQFNLEARKIKNLVEPGLGYIKFSRNERADKIKIIPLNEREIEEADVSEDVEDYEEMEVEEESEEDENVEEGKNDENIVIKKDDIRERFQNLKRIFFYDNEKSKIKILLRISIISIFFLLSFWSLYYFKIRNAILFFILAFIWTPLFTHNLEINEEKIKLFNLFRFLLSCLIFIFFYFF
jgi:DNA polymerase III delta prime subunit